MSKAKVAVRLAAVVAGLCAAVAAPAQTWPGAKPIRFIIPFPPGGGTDIVARVIQPRLQERLGTQILIDNRPGANTIVGTELTAKAAPDGYTMLMATSGHGINPSVYARLPFDPVKDFVPAVHVSNAANLLAVHPGLAAATLRDLVAAAKAQPSKFNYSSAGLGTVQQLTVELLKLNAGFDMQHVAYKGGAPAILAALGGEVSLVVTSITPLFGHVKSGKLRSLAVSGAKRAPALPEVPTIIESGFAGIETYYWLGIMFPAGTPAATVERMNREVNAVLALADIREQLLGQGADAVGGTPRQLGEFLREEIDRWAKVVKSTGLRLE